MILLFEYAECFLFGMLAATIIFAIACRRSWLYCPRCNQKDWSNKHQADWLKEANKTIDKLRLRKQANCDCEVYEICPECRDQGDQL